MKNTDIFLKINDILKTYGIDSCSLTLADMAQLPQSHTYRKANKAPIDNEVMYPILSISKFYAAYLTLLLADEGKIDLDQPISVYIPFLKLHDGSENEITVKMLLENQSGLPQTTSFGSVTGRPERNYLKYVVQSLSKATRRNDVFAKENDNNASLLEMIIEQVTEKPYAALVEMRILQPLELAHTQLMYQPYEADERITSVGLNHAGIYLNALAAKGISASSSDTARFMLHMTQQMIGWNEKYKVDLGSLFNGISPNRKIRMQTSKLLSYTSFVLCAEGKVLTILVNGYPDENVSDALVDIALLLEIGSKSVSDLTYSPDVLKDAEGLFAGSDQLYRFEKIDGVLACSSLPVDKYQSVIAVEIGKRTYLQVRHTTPLGVEITEILAQRLHSSPFPSWWHQADLGFILHKMHPGALILPESWLFVPEFTPEAPDTMCKPYLLRVMNASVSVPAVELPSGNANTSEDCLHIRNALLHGLNEYVNLNEIKTEMTEIAIDDYMIHWTKSSRFLDSVKMIGNCTMFMVDETGDLLFDSRDKEGLPETAGTVYYGWMGKKGSRIELQWTEVSDETLI